MSRPEVLTSSNDADLLTDLEIIALNEPGKGQALKRIAERAGLTQKDLAEKLGYDRKSSAGRSTVNMWYSERRWPPAATIRQALTVCNVDRKLLLDRFGIALGTEVTPASEGRQLLVALRNELAFEFDEFERRDIIFRNTAEKVLLFQAFKAFEDVRAAQLFFERLDKHEELRRLRASETALNVTPKSQEWSSGQSVYEPAKKRVTSPDEPVPKPSKNGDESE